MMLSGSTQIFTKVFLLSAIALFLLNSACSEPSRFGEQASADSNNEEPDNSGSTDPQSPGTSTPEPTASEPVELEPALPTTPSSPPPEDPDGSEPDGSDPSDPTDPTVPTDPIDPTIASTSTPPLFGTFANYTKNSQVTAMFDDDPKEMVKVAQETNQKIIIYPAYDGDPNQSCDTDGDGDIDIFETEAGSLGITHQYFCTFLQILEATKNTDIQVMALYPEKHQRSSIRWLDEDAYDTAYTAGDEATKRILWLDALKKNAEELSHLATIYPQLTGLTVDDMGLYFCGPEDFDSAGNRLSDKCYTPDELKILRDAGKKEAPIDFIPTTYLHYGWMTHLLNEAYIQGGLYGSSQYAGRYTQMHYVYNPSLTQTITQARFSMMLVDYNDAGPESWGYTQASKMFLVNGKIRWSEPFEGEQYVRFFDEDVLSDFNPAGLNEIMIKVAYDTNTSGTENTLMAVSQPKLTINGTEVSCSVETLEPNVTGNTNIPAGTCTLYLERKGEDASALVAASYEKYRIDQAVDGALTFYSPRSSEYHADSHRELYEQTLAAVPDLDIFSAYYGNLWVTDVTTGTTSISSADIDPAILSLQINDAKNAEVQINETTVAKVKGVVLWGAPVGLARPDGGVFTKRISDQDRQLFMYYPSYQSGYEGWYQQWTTTDKVGGDVTVCLKDNNTSIYDNDALTPRYFTKKIFTRQKSSSAETLYYQDGIGGNECGDSANPAYSSGGSLCPGVSAGISCQATCQVQSTPCSEGDERITFTLSTPAYVTIGMKIAENKGDGLNVKLDADIYINDALLEKQGFVFASDVAEQRLKDIWEAIVGTFGNGTTP